MIFLCNWANINTREQKLIQLKIFFSLFNPGTLSHMLEVFNCFRMADLRCDFHRWTLHKCSIYFQGQQDKTKIWPFQYIIASSTCPFYIGFFHNILKKFMCQIFCLMFLRYEPLHSSLLILHKLFSLSLISSGRQENSQQLLMCIGNHKAFK